MSLVAELDSIFDAKPIRKIFQGTCEVCEVAGSATPTKRCNLMVWHANARLGARGKIPGGKTTLARLPSGFQTRFACRLQSRFGFQWIRHLCTYLKAPCSQRLSLPLPGSTFRHLLPRVEDGCSDSKLQHYVPDLSQKSRSLLLPQLYPR